MAPAWRTFVARFAAAGANSTASIVSYSGIKANRWPFALSVFGLLLLRQLHSGATAETSVLNSLHYQKLPLFFVFFAER
jgi:hypothetical protein